MSVDYRFIIMRGFLIPDDLAKRIMDKEEYDDYIISFDYYDDNRYYFGKIVREGDAGIGYVLPDGMANVAIDREILTAARDALVADNYINPTWIAGVQIC
jgi:hypothetical protein